MSRMKIDEVVQQLKKQRSRIDAAVSALEGIDGGGKRRCRPPGSTKAATPVRRKRTMSAAARKLISEAQKKAAKRGRN
jgi:hypothetical protein